MPQFFLTQAHWFMVSVQRNKASSINGYFNFLKCFFFFLGGFIHINPSAFNLVSKGF